MDPSVQRLRLGILFHHAHDIRREVLFEHYDDLVRRLLHLLDPYLVGAPDQIGHRGIGLERRQQLRPKLAQLLNGRSQNG